MKEAYYVGNGEGTFYLAYVKRRWKEGGERWIELVNSRNESVFCWPERKLNADKVKRKDLLNKIE